MGQSFGTLCIFVYFCPRVLLTRQFTTMNIKTIFLFMSALLTLTSAHAQQVSEQEALQKAQQFFNKANLSSASRGRASRKAPELKLANNRSEFYVFNDRANGGYVVVSGDERMPDVLAYSYDGQIDANNVPCNMQAWLEEYAEQVKYLRAHPEAKATRRAVTERENIGPLLKCWFNQDYPYNAKCPLSDGRQCLTGCVATAMAQIMYYWQWPKQTTDTIPGYQSISKLDIPDLPAIPITTIDWDNILSEYRYGETYSDSQVDAISTLMLLCGTSVCMIYGPGSSMGDSFLAAKALSRYFDYDDIISHYYRDEINDTEEWEKMIYDELKDGRPVLYSASGPRGGHAFVLDGYEEGYFHVNWGWGGIESYVLMTDVEGWKDHNHNHYAFIGIQACRPDRPSRYAVLDNGKMTLYYDNKRSEHSAKILNHIEEWADYKEEITECVIDPSFAHLKRRDLSRLFLGLSNLKSIRGIENLNTSIATDISDMFWGCSSLTNIDVSNFKTNKVTNMGGMFFGCSSLTNIDVSGFNTQNVTAMYSMFCGCSSLTSLDVSNFKTDKVAYMSAMFAGCSGLTNLDVSGFNTQNVEGTSSMFSRCSGLTSLDVSNFKTDKVMDMNGMFQGCSGLTSLDVSRFKTDNVKYMDTMFRGCSGLTTLDLSGFITDNVKNMKYMFSNCPQLSTIYVSELWNMSNVEDADDMFYSCSSLVGGAGTIYDENHTDGEYAHVDGGPDNPGYFTYKEIPDAINAITPDLQTIRIYDLQGKRLDNVRKGLNIIRTSDGTIKKVVIK